MVAARAAEPSQGQTAGDESPSKDARVADAALRPRTVVVVPFVNITGQPVDEWLTVAIAETVAADLDRFAALTVVAHETFDLRSAGRSAELADQHELFESAREQGISWIVTGGFQQLGSQLRITARIVSVATGLAVESVKVDGEMADLFTLQDQIVEGLTVGFAEIAGVVPPAVSTGTPALEDSSPSAEDIVVVQSGSGVQVRDTSPADIPGGIAIGGASPQFGLAEGVGALTGRPTVRPPRIRSTPTIDGRLDDLAWQNAAVITNFVQRQPLDGAPATEATEVYIAYDDTNIYVGAHAHYTDPTMMRANRADRDRPISDDTFLVYFDPFLDQQRAYVFAVNAYGVQSDSILNSGPGGGRSRRSGGGRGGNFSPGRGGFGPGRGGPGGAPRGDDSWDALYDSAGQRVDDGFVVEMAIPFKSLRYPQRRGDVPHRWGFQIARTIRGKDESIVWSPVTREVSGFLPQMGVMEGMTDLSTSRNIEILPTFTTVQLGSLDTATRSFVDGDPDPEGGVNFKYGVTSNLTADFTYNPDFSQIESDQPQIDVNQRFDLFFPELRPFFLEGAEIFNFRGPVALVHTRTIADPQYGAKLTGKAGKTAIGVMYANDKAAGSLNDPGDPTFSQAAQTFVGRVRYDLYAESSIGAIYTDRQFLDSFNRVAGVDANFRVGDTHSFGIRAAGSEDRDMDGLETSGYFVNANLRKGGRNLSYNLAWYDLSPDFNTEVGFLVRTDQRWGFSNVSYVWWPETWLISWGPQVTYTRAYNFDGVLEDEGATIGVDFNFAKNIRTNFNSSSIMERFGGIEFQKTRFSTFTSVSTSTRYAVGLGYSGGDQIFFDEENPYLGFDRGMTIFVNARPFPRLNSNININTNTFWDLRNNNQQVFDVNIFRALTTYQFTDRFLFRNISEFNTFDTTFGLNLLFTYRVNSGTVFYGGYDDRYQQADHIERDLDGDGIDDRLFQTTATKRTNRAFFLKFQYLFRY